MFDKYLFCHLSSHTHSVTNLEFSPLFIFFAPSCIYINIYILQHSHNTHTHIYKFSVRVCWKSRGRRERYEGESLTAGVEPNYTVTHFPWFSLSLFWLPSWKILTVLLVCHLAALSSTERCRNEPTERKKKHVDLCVYVFAHTKVLTQGTDQCVHTQQKMYIHQRIIRNLKKKKHMFFCEEGDLIKENSNNIERKNLVIEQVGTRPFDSARYPLVFNRI